MSRGFLVIFLYLVWFSLSSSLFWELRHNAIVKNWQFWPSGGVMLEFYIQLFRERLSRKVHANNPERYCGWVWVHRSSNKFERMTRKAIDVCLWVPKESSKSSFDSFSVRSSVLIISHITFQDCRVRIFPDNLSRNSCIKRTLLC